jgi:DNA-binding XRE family transcriptional regulator
MINMDKATLKAWRQRQRLTQRELAKLLGVTPMCVAFWEWGKRRIPPFLPLALEALENRRKKGGSDGSVGGVSGVQAAE